MQWGMVEKVHVHLFLKVNFIIAFHQHSSLSNFQLEQNLCKENENKTSIETSDKTNGVQYHSIF